MTPRDPSAARGGLARTVVEGWDRFWFRPADPTVLGFVRILVGFIGLYVHFAYTGDLLDFVGPDGWINKQTMDVFRRQVGSSTRPPDWSDPNEMIAAPIDPSTPVTAEERAYVQEWDGTNPRSLHARGYWAWSIYYHVTDPTWIYIIHGCVLVIFFLLAIGLGTRVVSVLAWLATLSYVQRHYVAFFGMDTILCFTTLYLAIGSSGAALSFDRLLQRYARAWRALRASGSARKAGSINAAALHMAEGIELDRPRPSVSANLALRLIQVHMCIVYFAAGTSKLMGPAWWNGTALWGTMINPEFCPVYSEPYMAFLRFLCQYRWLWELFTTGGVLFTLAFEISFPFLVWNRWLRWTMILGAILLHVGIAFFMGLTPFSLIMISAVASFVPRESVDRLLRRLTLGKDHFRLNYVPRNRGQVRAASVIRAVDLWNQVHFVHGEPAPAKSGVAREAAHPSRIELVTEKDDVLTGYPLFERLVQSIGLLRPVGWLTRIPGVGAAGRTLRPCRCDSCENVLETKRHEVKDIRPST